MVYLVYLVAVERNRFLKIVTVDYGYCILLCEKETRKIRK